MDEAEVQLREVLRVAKDALEAEATDRSSKTVFFAVTYSATSGLVPRCHRPSPWAIAR